MKCFICHYLKQYNYSAYDEHHYVTFANTENEALMLCLKAAPHTKAATWRIYEQEITVGAVHVASGTN